MKYINRVIALLIVLGFFSKSNAQFYEIGFGFGKSVYWGDLNSPEFSKNINNNGGLAFQMLGKYNYRGIAGLKAGILFGKLAGNDANSSLSWQNERNLNFSSKLVEASLMAEYYFFGFAPGHNENIFSPFVTLGIAGFYYNPTTEYLGNTIELQPLGTEGQGMPGYDKKYNKYNFGMPFGAGVLVKLNSKINISVDIIGRKTFSDYIDDVSTSYVSYDALSAGNGQLAAILSDRTPEYLGIDEPSNRMTGDKRGGEKVEDYYFTAMISAMISLTDPDIVTKRKSNYKGNCPKF